MKRVKKNESEMTFTEVHRRKQIIETAIHIISRDGFQKTTIANIAKEAGFTKGVIFYYFNNKEELAVQISQTLLDDLRSHTRRHVQAVAPLSDMLKAYVDAYLGFIETNRDKFSILMELGMNLNLNTKDPLFSSETFLECRKRLGELLNRDGKLVNPAKEKVDDLSTVLQGTLDGIGLQYISDHRAVDLNGCKTIIFAMIDAYFHTDD